MYLHNVFLTVDMKGRCKLCGGSEESFHQMEYKDWVSII